MNITYILKHFLPRKAKEKENKHFVKDFWYGVLGGANCLSSLHPLENIINKIEIIAVKNVSL